MTIKDKYIVDGYAFSTEEEAEEAKNEVNGIEYLKSRSNFNKIENILAVYNKVLEKKLFKTPIGYNFLKELQSALYASEAIEDTQILPIPVLQTSSKVVIKQKLPKTPKRLDLSEKEVRYKNWFHNMIIFSFFLIVLIVLIVLITNNSSNTNILNYKARIDREFEEKEDTLVKWSDELAEKESSLNELEKNIQ